MSVSTGYPSHKPVPRIGTRGRAPGAKLALAQRTDLLVRVPLFAGLTKRQTQALARACSTHSWTTGSRVVVEGAHDQYCVIIVEGTVEVRRRGRLVGHLGPGEFFGEIALLDPGPRSATVTTTTDVLAVELSHRAFCEVASSDAQILMRMLETLAHRFREVSEKVAY